MKTKTFFAGLIMWIITFSVYTQDKIIKKNQEILTGKIIEVGIAEIKYKTSDNLNGPDYVITKNDVLLIVYENGKIDKITSVKEDKKKNYIDSSYFKYNNSISFDLISPAYSDISLAYEKRVFKKTLIGFKIPLTLHYSKNFTPAGYPIVGLNIDSYYQFLTAVFPNISVISTTQDSVLLRFREAKQTKVSNIGFRTGLQTKFYFSQPKKINWFIGPEIILGYSQGKIVKEVKDEDYWVAKDEYYSSNYNNKVLKENRSYNEIFTANRFLLGTQFTTGFEYRPMPRLSLGIDIGLGYAAIIDFGDLQHKNFYRDAYGNYYIDYANPLRSIFTWRGAFNLGINF